MKILGITGPSGSGKTTLCGIIKNNYRATIIDADEIARSLSSDNKSEYFKEMILLFGNDVLKEDGSLNRKKVAKIIFTNKSKRHELNKLTFKYVVQEIKKRIDEINENEFDFLAIDVPILYEAKMESICDYVIAVVADDEDKITRICKRDGIERDVARKRLEIQNSNSFFVKKADFVIYNDKTINNLEKSLKEIIKKIWESGLQD